MILPRFTDYFAAARNNEVHASAEVPTEPLELTHQQLNISLKLKKQNTGSWLLSDIVTLVSYGRTKAKHI